MSSDRLLLTWLDVERMFKQASENFCSFPQGVSGARCYSDGAEVEAISDQAAKEWIQTIFGNKFNSSESTLTFAIENAQYPIDILISAEKIKTPIQYPLWRELAYIKKETERKYPPDFNGSPQMVSFHSFKGGVGRTTALMTYAAALLNASKDRNVKILIVDADIEAPGVSFWLDPTNRPTVSFVQFLEATHYPPISLENSLDYFSAELKKTSINVDGVRKEIFVLPAAHVLSDVMDMPVQPAHLARNPENPWLLTDCLHRLGEKLQVDMVFVDLRAGLSELSSPIIFDSRVEHFFVSTVAPQSVIGMATVLEHLGRYQAGLVSDKTSISKPSVILSLLTPVLRKLPEYAASIEKLNAAYSAEDDDDSGDALSPLLDWVEADFESTLMSIGSFRQALDMLLRSPLYESALIWAESRNKIVAHIVHNSISQLGIPDTDDSKRLQKICETFQFAEMSTSAEMLVTDPLRNLAKHYSSELPNVVSVGAKGAGKTFTYLQLCRTKTWEAFLLKVGLSGSGNLAGQICPVLSSQNIDGDSLSVVKEAVSAAQEVIGNTSTGGLQIRSKLAKLLLNRDTDWISSWETLLVEEVSCGQEHSFSALNEWLGAHDKSVVFVIDGVEDAFDRPVDDSQRQAIKALLEIPNILNSLSNRRIGFVCFVRADYVQVSIRQNIAQYLSRFQPFRLEWTPETFLRLVYWICSKASVIDAKSEASESLSIHELLGALERLWGKKMGGDDSKEANTARWVFAALCDLNGRLQARDIVRFLKFAAKQMSGRKADAWPDRVLHPEAIRKSLAECSREKVEEASAEIVPLKEWQGQLLRISEDAKKVPFNPSQVGLSEELTRALKDIGVIYEDIDRIEDADRFYLPEIYRTGLGFKSAVGGRPRVQALLKRNLGGMPF